jgi:peroxiredoxin
MQLSVILTLVCAASPVGGFDLVDAKGVHHSAAEWKDRKAVVLIFLGIDCPVSNGSSPEIVRLARDYTGRGVLVWGVHSDSDVRAAQAARHAADYGLPFPVLLDPEQELAGQAGVQRVPSAVVLTSEGKIQYRGRIDDRWTADGKRRPAATRHDLQEALEALLAGKPLPSAETLGFGCPLPKKTPQR